MTILVATPQYLTRYGAPESPDDLNRFRSVVFVERGSVQPWSIGSGQDANDGRQSKLPVNDNQNSRSATIGQLWLWSSRARIDYEQTGKEVVCPGEDRTKSRDCGG